MTDQDLEKKRKIEFRIDPDRLEWGWIIDAQEGNYKAITLAMAASLLDEKGDFLDREDAYETLRKLSPSEVNKIMGIFLETFRNWSVPPQSAAS